MKKLIYILCLYLCMLNTLQAQIFQENFETFDPRYGTNVVNDYQCPSISFLINRNTRIDCLTNWRTLTGTPSLGLDYKNICGFAPSRSNCLSMWSGRTNESQTIGESAFINSIQFMPNTEYSITYSIKVKSPIRSTAPVPTSATFNIWLTNNLNASYYSNQGSCGSQFPININFISVESLNLNTKGSDWTTRTVNFTTDNNSYNQILFFPVSAGATNTQTDVQIDDITINRCDYKTSSYNIKYTSSNTPIPFQTVALNSIIANGNSGINYQNSKEFIAGKEIVLENAFTVEEGASFDAKIEKICLNNSVNTNEISVFIPNVMTRNCDGINDSWVVMDGNKDFGPLYAIGFNLKIYNSWGGLVYSDGRNQTSFIFGGDIQWDGNDVVNGEYYYELELYSCTNTVKFYKGYITIIGDCVNKKNEAINTKKDSIKITIYPNPSNGKFMISSAENIEEVIIYNSFGEDVKANITNLNDKSIQVEVTNHKVGIYLVRLRTGKEWIDKKVIIE